MSPLLLLFLLSPAVLFADNRCPDNRPRLICHQPVIFLLDVSSTMETTERIETLFDWFSNILVPQIDFPNYQTIQIMTYGSNSTPLSETWDYEKTVCPALGRLRQDALDNGLQDVTVHDALKNMKKTFGDEFGAPVIIFTAENNQTDIDASIKYKQKNLDDEYFTLVLLNSSFQQWKWFYATDTYTVDLDQIYDYKNLDFCVLYAACKENTGTDFCDVYPPSTTKNVATTAVPAVPVTNPSTPVTSVQCQCNGACKSTSDCSCPKGSFSVSTDSNGLPEDGCYYNPGPTLNYALAQRKCSALGGFVTKEENRHKHDWFFTDHDLFPKGKSELIWIGLVFDRVAQKYYWPDNSTLGTFTPWDPTVKLPPPAGQDCVIDTLDGWYTTDCRNSYGFICELPPCDSRGYCTPLS